LGTGRRSPAGAATNPVMRPLAALAALVLVAAACSSDDSVPEGTSAAPPTETTIPVTVTPSTVTTTQAPPTEPIVPRFEASGDEVVGPGTYVRTLRIDDADRTYVLHLSSRAWSTMDIPLVIDLHGLTATPERQDALSGFRDKADEEGFAVAQPQAAGSPATWQAGLVLSPDVAFLRAVISDVAAHLDLGPVYVAGFSNGAGMAHRFACDVPDEVSAIGTVAGAYPDTGPCGGPVSVIAFHGVRDPVVPFDGAGSLLPAIVDWAASWADRAGCAGIDVTEIAPGVDRRAWEACEAGAVELYAVSDGRHGWPGTRSPTRLFDSTSRISATDLMWEFFTSTAG
jgi:polyhydroxybutyrate depolymerase